VPILFGHAFDDAVPVAIVLVGAYSLVALKTILVQGLKSFGEGRSAFIAAAVSLMLFFALALPAGQILGLVGIATALAVAEIGGLWYLACYLGRNYEISFRDLWGLTPGVVAEARDFVFNLRPNSLGTSP
jgi:O-antigen/teichoic acid export membrane protein